MKFLKTFETITGRKIPFQIFENRQGDVMSSIASPVKANTYLNWRANLSIESMCIDTWNSAHRDKTAPR